MEISAKSWPPYSQESLMPTEYGAGRARDYGRFGGMINLLHPLGFKPHIMQPIA